ncbi:MAG: tetratricopeptide repeat protein [Hyphomicrobiales bacterium]|nr:tetratricopeptide repeat protein [Hyphomicrobiales bacterium]MCP5000805.1 tetratricopeptide repeat protein [Hyphomicrobiales bacterium]
MKSDNSSQKANTFVPGSYAPELKFSISYGPFRFEQSQKEEPKAAGGGPHFKKFLKSSGEIVQGLRTLFFNTIFLCLVLFLMALAVFFAFSENRMVIEKIKVPKALLAIGYTEDVAADRLSDAIGKIEQAAKRRRNNFDVMPKTRQIDIKIPEIGTLFDTALHYTKVLFSKQDTIVAGEFICSSVNCDVRDVYLRLRVYGNKSTIVSLPPIRDSFGDGWEDAYFRQAALQILDEVNPYFVAAYFYDQDPDRTLRIARRIIRTEKKATEIALAYNLIGVTNLHQEKYDAAIANFKKSIEADDKLAEAYSNWGNALLSQNDVKGAIAQYRSALAVDPEFASAHSNIGDALLREHQIDSAIAQYHRAININPQTAYAYINLGYAWTRKGEDFGNNGQPKDRQMAYSTAFEHFRDAIEIDQNLVLAHTSWADALMKVGRFDEAEQKLEDGLKIATEQDIPNQSGTLANLYAGKADLFVKRKMEREAIAAYRAALEHRPDNTRALAGLGDALLRQNKYGEALEAFQSAISRRSGHVNALIGLGDTYFKKGKEYYDEASDAYKKAAAAKPDAYRAYEGLGNVAVRQKEYEQAVGFFMSAVTHNIKAVHSHAGLAYAQAKSGETENAVSTYLTALEIKPGIAYIQRDLADTIRRLPDWQSARDMLDKATKIAPNAEPFYRVWISLITKHERSDDYPVVLELWRNAVKKPEPHILLGEYFLKENKTMEAASAFGAALVETSGPPDPFYSRAQNGLLSLGYAVPPMNEHE